MAKAKRDIYQEITNQVIAKVEADPKKWSKSWATSSAGYPTRFTGQAYKGVNLFLLMLQGRGNANWMTYKQAQSVGAQVRTGEKGAGIVFFKPLKIEKNGKEETIPLLRSYTVFNAEQIDNLPEKFFPDPLVPQNNEPRIDEAEAYFKACGADVRYGGNRAFFSPSQDFIQNPDFDQFFSAVEFYGTLGHEFIHWTGGEKRLDRNFKSSDGTKDCAKEELTAELGACFLMSRLNIETEVREDHASYVASWLKALKGDKKYIFRASASAQKAVDYLDTLQEIEVAKAA